MNPNDQHIILDKQLRRDIDEIIQRLKEAARPRTDASDNGGFYRASRERSLAITKLQESCMWLGMDLKAINDENPPATVDPTEMARDAYLRYGKVTDFKNFQGNPMPKFEELPEKIQEAWVAVIADFHPGASAMTSPGNPYPNSKDPSNTVIDKTADGLKL